MAPNGLLLSHLLLQMIPVTRVSLHRSDHGDELQQRVNWRNWGKSQDSGFGTVAGVAIEAYFPSLLSTFDR